MIFFFKSRPEVHMPCSSGSKMGYQQCASHSRYNCFHFNAVSAKMWLNNCLVPSLLELASQLSGKSWTRHCMVLLRQPYVPLNRTNQLRFPVLDDAYIYFFNSYTRKYVVTYKICCKTFEKIMRNYNKVKISSGVINTINHHPFVLCRIKTKRQSSKRSKKIIQ